MGQRGCRAQDGRGQAAQAAQGGDGFGYVVHRPSFGVWASAVAVPRTDAARDTQSGAVDWSMIP